MRYHQLNNQQNQNGYQNGSPPNAPSASSAAYNASGATPVSQTQGQGMVPAGGGGYLPSGTTTAPTVGPTVTYGADGNYTTDPSAAASMQTGQGAGTTGMGGAGGMAAAGAISSIASALQNYFSHPAQVKIPQPPPAPGSPNFQAPNFGGAQVPTFSA